MDNAMRAAEADMEAAIGNGIFDRDFMMQIGESQPALDESSFTDIERLRIENFGTSNPDCIYSREEMNEIKHLENWCWPEGNRVKIAEFWKYCNFNSFITSQLGTFPFVPRLPYFSVDVFRECARKKSCIMKYLDSKAFAKHCQNYQEREVDTVAHFQEQKIQDLQQAAAQIRSTALTDDAELAQQPAQEGKALPQAPAYDPSVTQKDEPVAKSILERRKRRREARELSEAIKKKLAEHSHVTVHYTMPCGDKWQDSMENAMIRYKQGLFNLDMEFALVVRGNEAKCYFPLRVLIEHNGRETPFCSPFHDIPEQEKKTNEENSQVIRPADGVDPFNLIRPCPALAQRVIPVNNISVEVERLATSFRACDRKQLRIRADHIFSEPIRCDLCQDQKKVLRDAFELISHFLGEKHQEMLLKKGVSPGFRQLNKDAIAFWKDATAQCTNVPATRSSFSGPTLHRQYSAQGSIPLELIVMLFLPAIAFLMAKAASPVLGMQVGSLDAFVWGLAVLSLLDGGQSARFVFRTYERHLRTLAIAAFEGLIYYNRMH